MREAVGALTHLGLLESRVGDGTYVRSVSEIEGAMVRQARRCRNEDVLELRGMLESYAAGLAARRRTAADLDRLRRALDAAAAAIPGGHMPDITETDAVFHREVVRSGGNPLLSEVYESLQAAIAEQLERSPWDKARADRHRFLHRRLLDAIAAGDEADARGAAADIVALTGQPVSAPASAPSSTAAMPAASAEPQASMTAASAVRGTSGAQGRGMTE